MCFLCYVEDPQGVGLIGFLGHGRHSAQVFREAGVELWAVRIARSFDTLPQT